MHFCRNQVRDFQKTAPKPPAQLAQGDATEGSKKFRFVQSVWYTSALNGPRLSRVVVPSDRKTYQGIAELFDQSGQFLERLRERPNEPLPSMVPVRWIVSTFANASFRPTAVMCSSSKSFGRVVDAMVASSSERQSGETVSS